MKRWIFAVFTLLFLGIGIIVYKNMSMGLEQCLEAAADPDISLERRLLNLNKALELSKKQYGDRSESTAEIYKMIGQNSRDAEQVNEYFDKAVVIYQLMNLHEKAGDVMYAKGVRMMNSYQLVLAQESFEEAIDIYESYGYSNAEYICLSFYNLAQLSDSNDKKMDYLLKGIALIHEITQEQYVPISMTLYLEIANTYLNEGEIELAFLNYEEIIKNKISETDPSNNMKIAEAYGASALCQISLGKTEDAKVRLHKAIQIYEYIDINVTYLQLSVANIYLALAYSKQAQPDEMNALYYGEKAFSFYEAREVMTNIDIDHMSYCKAIMEDVYKTIFPEKESWEFDEWCAKHINVRATTYKYYTH